MSRQILLENLRREIRAATVDDVACWLPNLSGPFLGDRAGCRRWHMREGDSGEEPKRGRAWALQNYNRRYAMRNSWPDSAGVHLIPVIPRCFEGSLHLRNPGARLIDF